MVQRWYKVLALLLVFLSSAVVIAQQGAPEADTEANTDPQYGGTLNVGTVYVTLSALSWDPADWTWKSNHDAGSVREQL